MYKKILAGLAAGVLALPAFSALELDSVTHLKFDTDGSVIGRSETTNYILRNKEGWKTSLSGLTIINPNQTFSLNEQIAKATATINDAVPAFFENYPNLPNNPNQYGDIGITENSTNEEYKEVADYYLSQGNALLKGGNIILELGDGYQGVGISGDYLLIATGSINQQNYLRCNLSNFSNQTSSEYLQTCTSLNNVNYTPAANNPINYTPITEQGYVLVPADSDSSVKEITVMYPNGDVFKHPESNEDLPIHINDKSNEAVIFIGNKRFQLTPTGLVPNLISGFGDDSSGVFLQSNDEYNYLWTEVEATNGNSKNATYAFICKPSDTLNSVSEETYTPVNLTMTELAEIFALISHDDYVPLLKNYPELPDSADRANLETSLDGYLANMTQEQFLAWINPIMEAKRNDIETNINTKNSENVALNNLARPEIPCADGSIIRLRELDRNPSIGTTPNKMMAENNNYLQAIGDSYIIRNTDQNETIIDIEAAAQDQVNKIPSILKGSFIESLKNDYSEIFDGYPEISRQAELYILHGSPINADPNLFIRYYRSVLILNKMGITAIDPFLSKYHAQPQLGSDGNYLLATTGATDTRDAWIITTKLTDTNEEKDVQISISTSKPAIDPYDDPTGQFSIDIEGTDIYALDVQCEIPSSSLTITNADYNNMFGAQNSMTLPLAQTDSTITGTETLVAPELPFTGASSFALADVIAEFTTEDVDVVCAAEVSDVDGNLMSVGFTPAVIKIDDGVHGGNAAISGTINIPGVENYAGVEVTLNINGRQVVVTTDENGNFTFDELRDGDFIISMESENYVQSCQNVTITEGGSVNLGTIEMLAGDINADGTINIADFTYLAARYRSQVGDADYDEKADLNKDGIINIQDLAILGSHFGSTQCDNS